MINTPKRWVHRKEKSLVQSVQVHINSVIDSKGFRYKDNSAENFKGFTYIEHIDDDSKEFRYIENNNGDSI